MAHSAASPLASVGLKGGVDEKLVLAFEVVRAIGLDIDILSPENIQVFALIVLSLLLKDFGVFVWSATFVGTQK
jgi:hypothetical protein